MPIEVGHGFRVVAFGIWALLYAILFIAELHWADQQIWVFVPSALVSLTLIAFLLFKAAHYFPSTSALTTKWHNFFYAERKGSMALLVLCLIWCFDVICTLIDTFADLTFSGAIEKTLEKLGNQGMIGMIMSDGLKMFIAFYSLFLTGWVFWTGFKAFWRIKAPVSQERDYEIGLGLVSGQSH